MIDETHVEMSIIERLIDEDRFMDTHWVTRAVDDVIDLAETVDLYRDGFGYASDDGIALEWVGVVVAGCGDRVWRAAERAARGDRPRRAFRRWPRGR